MAIARAKKTSVLGRQVSFASPEDLVIHKVIAGRPQDLDDVSSVVLKNQDMDKDHIRKWLRSFDETFPEKGYLKTFEEILAKIKK